MTSTAEDPVNGTIICPKNNLNKQQPPLHNRSSNPITLSLRNLLNYSKNKEVKMKKSKISLLKQDKVKKKEDIIQRRKTTDALILRNTYDAFQKVSKETAKENIYTNKPKPEINKETLASIEKEEDYNYEVLRLKSTMEKSEELNSSSKSPLSLAEFLTSSCSKRIPPKLPNKYPGMQKRKTESNLTFKLTMEPRKLSLPTPSPTNQQDFDPVTAHSSGIEKIKLTGNDSQHSASASSTNILNLEGLPSDLDWSTLTVEDITDFLSLLHINSDIIKTFIEFNIDGKRLKYMSKEMLSNEPFGLNEFYVEQIYLFMNGWRPKHSNICSRWSPKNQKGK